MAKMVYRRNVVPGGANYGDMRDTLVRDAKKSLTRYDRTLNEDALDTVLKTLNDLADMLGGRKPKDEVENEEGCDCAENGRVCHCVDDEAEDPQATPDTKANRAFAQGFRANTTNTAVDRLLRKKAGRNDFDDLDETDRAAERRRAAAEFYTRKDQARKLNSRRPIQNEEDALVHDWESNRGSAGVMQELRKRGR